jgi:hypothetical protein
MGIEMVEDRALLLAVGGGGGCGGEGSPMAKRLNAEFSSLRHENLHAGQTLGMLVKGVETFKVRLGAAKEGRDAARVELAESHGECGILKMRRDIADAEARARARAKKEKETETETETEGKRQRPHQCQEGEEDQEKDRRQDQQAPAPAAIVTATAPMPMSRWLMNAAVARKHRKEEEEAQQEVIEWVVG